MFRHFFVIGVKGLSAELIEKLNVESDKYGGDLLLLREITDSYEQLTLKTLAAIR